ncbi:hypothetical protein ACYCFK_17870 [Stutzerimonas stutzeri]
MTTRRKTLPALSPKAPAELRPLFAAMVEILETGEGIRGDKLDRKLTMRDLLESGIAKLRVPGNADGGLTPPPIGDFPKDMTVPPVPTGFAADGSFFGMVHLSWDPPQKRYGNHAFARIYRSDTDDFGTASVVGMEPGMFYSDIVRADALSGDLTLDGHYYWITFVSTSDVEGPPNSPNGTFARPLPDVQYILETLSRDLADEPSTVGAPDETFIINAKRFAVRIDPDSGPVFPLIIANVGGKPTVVLDTTLIRQASIQEGQLGPITFGKLFDSSGRPVTTVGGKLRADMIDVNGLTVYEANIANAAITSAKIRDASITNAKIGDLAVDTLKLAGHAVTIPLFAQAFAPVSAVSWVTVLSLVITTPQAGWLYASSSGYIGYGQGWGDTDTMLTIDGVEVSGGGGESAWVSVAHSGARYVAAGTHTVELRFRSPSGKATIFSRSLFAMLVKR